MIDSASALLNLDNLSVESIEADIALVNEKLEALSAANDFTSDNYISLTKRLNKLNALIDDINSLTELLEKFKQAQEMLDDPDLKDLAKTEIAELEPELKKLMSILELATQKPLKNDSKKAIVEIRPGVGGVEASLFAEDLFRMYTKYCLTENFKVEQYTLDYDTEGGIKGATFLVDEDESFGHFRFESGVHRVQRVPSTESAGRIHTSTASVVVLPQMDKKDVKINAEDLKVDVFRSSGPGGQSVNTTDSAVRLTHIPTGITVTCQNSKSQHQNKDTAMAILMSKLSEIEEEKMSKEESDIRASSILSGDRSVKIRTYNFQQSRITDHRINKSWFNLEPVLGGDIKDIVTSVSKELRDKLK